MSFLTIKNLKKTYGKATALAGVDLTIEEGEFVTLLGPSGSGKTTLLMSIAGFTEPDSGSVVLKGEDITAKDPEDRDFGLVFQGYALFPHLSVADNIAFPLRVRKWDKGRMAKRVDEMLSLVGLDQMAHRKPRELSGGQQQRVALARSLAFGPKLLLLDEPLSALDRTLRDSMQRELKRLHQETGVTFVYVTHDQEEAYAMSDSIAVFQNGHIVQVGEPRDIYQKPASLFVAGFLGGNNIVSARHEGEMLKMFGKEFRAPEAFNPSRHAFKGDVTAWIRPEDLRFGQSQTESLEFPVKIDDISFIGSAERVTAITADKQEITVLVPPGMAPDLKPGTDTTAHFPFSTMGFLVHE